MATEVTVPSEYQGAAVAQLAQRKGLVQNMDGTDYVTITADVPLDNMFGYSNDLRGATQGKGEYAMEYKIHSPVPRDKQVKPQPAALSQPPDARTAPAPPLRRPRATSMPCAYTKRTPRRPSPSLQPRLSTANLCGASQAHHRRLLVWLCGACPLCGATAAPARALSLG